MTQTAMHPSARKHRQQTPNGVVWVQGEGCWGEGGRGGLEDSKAQKKLQLTSQNLYLPLPNIGLPFLSPYIEI